MKKKSLALVIFAIIGLGLYICKSHIEAMNGSLTYEYSDHKLIFTIILPIA